MVKDIFGGLVKKIKDTTEDFKVFYGNLKIKNKLFILHFLIVFSVCSVSMLALQVVLKIYDDLLYDKAAQVLNLSTTTIENDLKRIEKLTFSMASDPSVQEYALAVKSGLADYYEDYTQTDLLMRRLQALASSESHIESVIFIDTRGKQFAGGSNSTSLKEKIKEQIVLQASEMSGNNIFMESLEEKPSLICARQIREIRDLNLQTLGTLVFRIDLGRSIQKYSSILPGYDVNLIILSGNRIVYLSNRLSSVGETTLHLRGEVGYDIRNINGKKMFIAYTTSQYIGWVYANVLPYGTIFQKIAYMRNIMILLFLVLFLTVVLVSMKFARNLTKPIENLSTRIENVVNSDFEINEDLESNRLDEVEQLKQEVSEELAKINHDSIVRKHSKLVESIMKHVQDNLESENLSLKYLASEVFYMNVGYLSKLFVKETGEKFTQYLTRARMEKAKELIENSDDDKIYEVAQRVGLGNNPQYFSQLFKKYTGFTPTEYKKRL